MFSVKYANVSHFSNTAVPVPLPKDCSMDTASCSNRELERHRCCQTEPPADDRLSSYPTNDDNLSTRELARTVNGEHITIHCDSSNSPDFSVTQGDLICNIKENFNAVSSTDIADAAFSYLCSVCGLACATKCDLSDHVRLTHMTESLKDEIASNHVQKLDELPRSAASLLTTLNRRTLNSPPLPSPSSSAPIRQPRRRTLDSADLSSSWTSQKMRRLPDGVATPSSTCSDLLTPVGPFVPELDPFFSGTISPVLQHAKLSSIRRAMKRRRGEGAKRLPCGGGGSVASSLFTYACKLCPRTFGAASSLNVHYTHTHRDKPQYDCEMCGAQFAVKRELATHRRLHDGQPTHRCHRCGKEFGTKQLLRKHELWHTGERTHVCPQCNKAFFQKGHLTQHLMIHAGGRPHACHLCPKTFIFKFDLNRHMKIHAERVNSAINESQHEVTSKSASRCAQDDVICGTESGEPFNDNLPNNVAIGENGDLKASSENEADDSATALSKNGAAAFSAKDDFASDVLSNGGSLFNSNLLFKAANNWTNLRDHLRNLHIGQLLGPVLDEQLKRFSAESDSQAPSKECENQAQWSLANQNSQSQLSNDAVSDEESADESKPADVTISSVLLTNGNHFADDDRDASSQNAAIETDSKAERIDFDDSVSQRSRDESRASPRDSSPDRCDRCNALKDQLDDCQEKIECLQNVVREKQGEIEALKCNVQHVGRLAGSLFKTCAEYETLWMSSDREISENVRRFLGAFM